MRRRPLTRRVIRLGFQIFGGRRRHWDEGFPHLSLELPTGNRPGKITWKALLLGRLLPFDSIAAQMPREEITLIGSGPSLSGQDLARVAPGAIVLNGAVSVIGQLGAPLGLAIEDERFVYGHWPMIAAADLRGLVLFLSPAAIRAICEHDPQFLVGRDVVLIASLLKPWRGARRGLEGLPVWREGDIALTQAPGIGVVPMGSVAGSALQLALCGPARQISFAGIDLGNADAPRFYEEAGKAAPSGIRRAESRILAHIALANRIATQNGRRLVCLSPVSSLLSLGIAYDPRLQKPPT